ncbi:hypothetical protein QBC38DRAFT_444753 [Podospora fimiseda]|uniref:Uncharacterized protein n=1 Tax=Podospora fimiseda TaxID=252190 RepID=A0AAN7GWU5_9PEZI|nr:hypothetical protein QBC38DRAFT_444753 [Podospora fimiseda]
MPGWFLTIVQDLKNGLICGTLALSSLSGNEKVCPAEKANQSKTRRQLTQRALCHHQNTGSAGHPTTNAKKPGYGDAAAAAAAEAKNSRGPALPVEVPQFVEHGESRIPLGFPVKSEAVLTSAYRCRGRWCWHCFRIGASVSGFQPSKQANTLWKSPSKRIRFTDRNLASGANLKKARRRALVVLFAGGRFSAWSEAGSTQPMAAPVTKQHQATKEIKRRQPETVPAPSNPLHTHTAFCHTTRDATAPSRPASAV